MSTIKAYKGFDKNWQCRGFQFEIGKTYKEDKAKLCESGFHACEAPLDCWSYYPPTSSVYAEVELGDVTKKESGDTKRAGKTITVKAAISIPMLIQAQVEWTIAHAKGKEIASGDSSTAASSGYSSKAASSGDSSNAASSGDSSTAASSGYYSNAASSGDYSKAASSGDYSKAASSGDYSKAASSGYSSTAASSGDYSKAASSGYSSTAACDTNGFACVAGIAGRVKGNAGSALSLGYQDQDGHNRIAVGYVGENGIKPDTWYRVNDAGKLVEVK